MAETAPMSSAVDLGGATPTGATGPALQPGRGNLFDELFAVLLLIVLPLEFPMAQPLRPFVALMLLGYVFLHWREVLPLIWRARWVLVLPGLAFLSGLWAADSVAAIRHGTLMSVAMLSAGAMAARLDPRQIAVAVLLSQGSLAVASVVTMTSVYVGGLDGGYALVGVFPHKNILGQRMVFTIIAGLVVAFSAGYRPTLKPIALGLVGVALFLISRSYSATAILLLAGAVPIALGAALVWRPATQVRGLRTTLVFGGLSSIFFTLLVLMNGFGIDPVSDLLGAFGKDATLTGRTVTWAAGNQSIADHPILGVGAGNFWKVGNFAADRLAERFAVTSDRFNFHNAYYEVLVHLGFLGLTAALFVYGRAAYLVARDWFSNQVSRDGFFVALIAVFLVRSTTESELFGALILGPILFWTVTFSVVRERLARV